MPPRYQRMALVGVTGFAWDQEKSEDCFRRRGWDFSFAAHMFRNDVLRRRDTRHKGQLRFQAIGRVGGLTLFVVYLMERSVCRIISARPATAEEAAIYHDRYTYP